MHHLKLLRDIKMSNVNRLIIGQLNINSLRNKFEALKYVIKDNIDIFIITESKLDDTFPTNQFRIDGYTPPFRLKPTKNGGGVIIYVREDIPSKQLQHHPSPLNFEGIFFEINLRKMKWLVFGGYNPNKHTIVDFVNKLGSILDHCMSKYENLLLLDDFNSEMSEKVMIKFCDTYNFKDLAKHVSYMFLKTVHNPSTIDLILTNKPRSFLNNITIESGLSDHHKLTITVMKTFFQKQPPITISYRDFKNFSLYLFRNELLKELYSVHGRKVDYDTFEGIIVRLLNQSAPIKEKYVRANNSHL